MDLTHEPADPIAKGVIPTAIQSLRDLFTWKQRVVVTNEQGETSCEWATPVPLKNPVSLMAQLSAKDWVFFLVGFAAWTADAFDFHALSIQTVKLADYYDVSKTRVTEAITLTLLLRSIGAAMFGLAGDKFGRKWPMVVNMLVLGLLQIATIYSKTFEQFLAVRSLFGKLDSIAYPDDYPLTEGRKVSSWEASTEMPSPWPWKTVLLTREALCLASSSKATRLGMSALPVPIWASVETSNRGRPYFGLLLVFRSALVLFGWCFPSLSSSLRHAKPARIRVVRPNSGRRQRSC